MAKFASYLFLMLFSFFMFMKDNLHAQTVNASNQMLLTKSLYMGFINNYFQEGDESFRPQYLAHKHYILTFLNQWTVLLESNPYKSTQEIFEVIRNGGGYLSKHYNVWQKLNSYKGFDIINLGYTKNMALALILKSEGEFAEDNLEGRISKILDIVKFQVLANSHDYLLTATIAFPFLRVENVELRQKAQHLIDSIPNRKYIETATFIRDMILPTKAAHLTALKADRYKNMLGRLGEIRKAATGFAGAFYKTTKSSTAALYRSVYGALNPYARQLTAAFISGGVHAGAILAQQDEGDPKQKLLLDTDDILDPLNLSLSMLWENVVALNKEKYIHTDVNYFNSDFLPASQENIEERIKKALSTGSEIDYLQTFLQAEKLLGYDTKTLFKMALTDSSDNLGLDFISGRTDIIKKTLKEKYKKPIAIEDLKSIRKFLIENYIKNYKRDYPNTTAMLLGWGGNCVAQTMLFLGVLKPLEKQFEEGLKLGFVLFTDHIEAVIFNDQKIYFTVSGKILPRANKNIYKPESLLISTLDSLGINHSYSVQDYLYAAESGEETGQKNKNSGDGFGISAMLTKAAQNIKAKFIRQGLLERLAQKNLKLFNKDNKNNTIDPTGIVPESANVKYTDFAAAAIGSVLFRDVLIEYSSKEEYIKSYNQKLSPKIFLDENPKSINGLFGLIIDNDANTITFTNKELFLEYRKLIAVNFQKEFYITLLEELIGRRALAIFESEPFKRLIIDPDHDLGVLLNWSDVDFKKAEAYRNAFTKPLPSIFDIVGERENPVEVLIKLPKNLISGSNLSYITAPLLTKNILKQIDDAPQKFIKIYSSLSFQGRQFLSQILSSATSMPTIRTDTKVRISDPEVVAVEYMEPIKTDEKMILIEKIRNYLDHLKNVEIEREAKACQLPYMDPNKFKLAESPVSLTWGPNGQYQQTNPECEDESNRYRKQAGSALKIKMSVLVELTALFGGGFQLWDQNVISDFTSNNYAPTIMGRANDLQIINNLEGSPFK